MATKNNCSGSEDEPRQRLVRAGIALIQKHGYHGVGIKDLVDAANIPKGSFYYYFPSKEEFVAAAIDAYNAPYLERLERLAAEDGPALPGLIDYFEAAVGEYDRDIHAGGCLTGNLLGEIGDTSRVALAALTRAVDSYQHYIARILFRAQSRREVRSDLSSDELAELVFDAWQGAILRVRTSGSVIPLTRMLDIVFGSLLHPTAD
jgi:TetR/AcrR family transcriptional repressor of nem operon